MLTFSYQARDANGQPVSDLIQAANRDDAIRQLQREGKVVTSIKLGSAPIDASEVLVRQSARQVGRDEVIGFSAQVGLMLETGVPLVEALGAYTSQSRSPHMQRVMHVVKERVTSGVPFSEAVREFPRVFPGMMVSLMQAAEASGTLAPMLCRISEYLGKERKTAKQIKGALTYPIAMVSIALIVTVFLVVWVLPRFAKIYESREAALPAPTKIVLGVSNFVTGEWVVLVSSLIGLFACFLYVRSTTTGRLVIDRLKIGLPVIGPMFTQLYLTRATRTLGTLLASGVTLLEAVRLVRGLTNNVLWSRLWDDVEEAMTAGRPISTVVLDSKLIPASVGQMIAAGENSGRLPEVLDRVSASTEEELDAAVKGATQLIEPALIVFMGVTIGGIALALLLPIFTIANVMSN